MKSNPGVVLRRARAGDGVALACVLRPADRAELAASHPGREAGALLEEFIACSCESVCLLYQGQPVALAGIYAPVLLGPSACVWLLSGRGIERCPVSFLRVAKKQLAVWNNRYPVLSNEVDARYETAVRFITHLGGQFSGKKSLRCHISFLHFTFRRFPWEEL